MSCPCFFVPPIRPSRYRLRVGTIVGEYGEAVEHDVESQALQMGAVAVDAIEFEVVLVGLLFFPPIVYMARKNDPLAVWVLGVPDDVCIISANIGFFVIFVKIK